MHINEADTASLERLLKEADIGEGLEIIGRVRQSAASPELIEEARELWATASRGRFDENDVEFDDDAAASPSDLGVFVQAWFWVAKPEGDEDEDEDALPLCPVDQAALERAEAMRP